MVNIKIGILKRFHVHNKIDEELEVYKKILRFNSIEIVDLEIDQNDFWEKVSSLDVFIYKFANVDDQKYLAYNIIPVIKKTYNIKCFPDLLSMWLYDEKIRQYYFLRSKYYPVVDSYIFYSKQKALQWIENRAEYPLIYKLSAGAGSMNVKLMKNKTDCKKMVNKMFGSGVKNGEFGFMNYFKTYNYNFRKIVKSSLINVRNKYFQKFRNNNFSISKNYVYFQKFLKNNEYDIRVTTAGDKVHAFRRLNRQNDFRASGSDLWDINPDKIDKRILKIALEISIKFNFSAMAYDFLYDEKKNPVIVEMSYLYGGAGYPDFMNGYWDKDLNWHEGRYWPQYFELMSLLNLPDFKMPDNLEYQTNYKTAQLDNF